MPIWTSHDADAAWWPPLAALLVGVQVLLSTGIALYALRWLARITADYTRRHWLAIALLAIAAANGGLAEGQQAAAAAATGLVEGVLLFGCVYALLRFDSRAVPAFVAAGVVLHTVESAALSATPTAWMLAAIAGGACALAAWAVTRYLSAIASATLSSPSAG